MGTHGNSLLNRVNKLYTLLSTSSCTFSNSCCCSIRNLKNEGKFCVRIVVDLVCVNNLEDNDDVVSSSNYPASLSSYFYAFYSTITKKICAQIG